MPNIIDMDQGRLLVASDIQGNWEDYCKIRSRFSSLKAEGKADILVLDGDLIHGYPGYVDNSVRILDDLIDNPDPAVIALLGNHELMHIYHMRVQKAGRSFVEPFEQQIAYDREKYVGFMKRMPYAIRTLGGVLINHTGASCVIAFAESDGVFSGINSLNHDDILNYLKQEIKESMKGIERELPENFFDKYMPAIGSLFARMEIGTFLWDVFFNKNEYDPHKEYAFGYPFILEDFLQAMSIGRPQNFLISGHIEVPSGYQVVEDRQLRICSSYGAEESRKTLVLVDASRNYQSIQELVDDLQLLNR